jgi:hypothetical protein
MGGLDMRGGWLLVHGRLLCQVVAIGDSAPGSKGPWGDHGACSCIACCADTLATDALTNAYSLVHRDRSLSCTFF